MPYLSLTDWLVIGGFALGFFSVGVHWLFARGLRVQGTARLSAMGLPELQLKEPLPAELLHSDVPRRVSLTRLGKIQFSAGLVAIVCGAIVAWLGGEILLDERHEQEMLRQDAIPATATVSGKYQGVKWVDRNPYQVYYRYPVDSVRHFGSAAVSEAVFVQLEKGASLPIHRSASEPEISRADGDLTPDKRLSRLLTILPILGLFAYTWQLFRQRRLLRRGKVTVGIVTGIETFDRYFLVGYHFRDLSGQTVHGVSRIAPDPELAIGTGLVILFDTSRPSRSSTYPLQSVYLPKGNEQG